jgi:hypothetical protein
MTEKAPLSYDDCQADVLRWADEMFKVINESKNNLLKYIEEAKTNELHLTLKSIQTQLAKIEQRITKLEPEEEPEE